MKKLLLPIAALATLALAGCSSIDVNAQNLVKKALEGDTSEGDGSIEPVEKVDHEYITLFNNLVSDEFLSISNGESIKEGFTLNTTIKAGSKLGESYTFELNYNLVDEKQDQDGDTTGGDTGDTTGGDTGDAGDTTGGDTTGGDTGDAGDTAGEVQSKLRHGGHGPKEDKEGHGPKDDNHGHFGHHRKEITRYEGELTIGESTYSVKGFLEDENEFEFFFKNEEGTKGDLSFEVSDNSKEFNFVLAEQYSLTSMYSYEVYVGEDYQEVVLVEVNETSEVIYGLAKATYEEESYLGVLIYDGENETYFLGKIVESDTGTTLEEVTFDYDSEDPDDEEDSDCDCSCPCCQDGHCNDSDDFDDFGDYDDFDDNDDYDDYDDFGDYDDFFGYDDFNGSHEGKGHGNGHSSHGERW